MQDDSSVQLALMVELLRGKPPAQLQLINKDSVREYHYQRARRGVAADSARPDCNHHLHQPEGILAARQRYWCAPGHGFIPMRVQQKKGEDVEWSMQIESLKRE